MNIRIYQINLGRDSDRVAFQDLEHLPEYQGSANVNSALYDCVFEGDVDCATLEDVFRVFNLEHPAEYTGRSLSVSDVVEIPEDQGVEAGFYFCNSIGFPRVEFDPAHAQPAVHAGAIWWLNRTGVFIPVTSIVWMTSAWAGFRI